MLALLVCRDVSQQRRDWWGGNKKNTFLSTTAMLIVFAYMQGSAIFFFFLRGLIVNILGFAGDCKYFRPCGNCSILLL